MTLNDFESDLVLNCVLRQHVWSSEAWLSKHMASLILVRNVVGELQPKRTLAASRGFLASARLSCSDFRVLLATRHRPCHILLSYTVHGLLNFKIVNGSRLPIL